MKKLQFARSGYIIISVIFYIAAVVYLIIPDLPTMVLCCFSGAILTAYGIIKITGFFSEELYCLAFRYDMAFGLLLMVAGVLVLAKNVSIAQYLVPGLGWFSLLDDLFHIQMSKEARDFGLEQWKLILCLSIASGVLSVLLIVWGSSDPRATQILVSVVLLAAGIMNHCIVKFAIYFPHTSVTQKAETE